MLSQHYLAGNDAGSENTERKPVTFCGRRKNTSQRAKKNPLFLTGLKVERVEEGRTPDLMLGKHGRKKKAHGWARWALTYREPTDTLCCCGLHRVVVIGLEPMNDCPPAVRPVRTAEVSPHLIPVSGIANRRMVSRSPSFSTSRRPTWIGAASVPVAPKWTVLGSTVVGSKPLSLKIATLMFWVLLGFILLPSL